MGEHQGSCLCGDVRFVMRGSFDGFFLCHCSRCRKGTGSAHGANLFSTTGKLEWLSGEENVRTFSVEGTRHQRSFCATCGGAAPRIHVGGGLVVPAGSLDTPLDIKPTAHICCASRADWDEGFADVPRFDGLPG